MVSAGAAVGIAAGVVGGLVALWHVGIWYEVDVKCEKPKFTLLQTLKSPKKNPVEIRRYAPTLIAYVTMPSDAGMRTALGSGFRQIAGFIFGQNTVSGDSQDATKVAMTSPVTLELKNASQSSDSASIAMTSPVASQLKDGEYTVSFIMPSKYTAETLPRPKNSNVKIMEVPARTMAAMGWRGRSPTEQAMDEKAAELAATLKEAGFKATGSVHLWQYHPPFAPPWQRKNEILYEIVNADSAATS